MHVYQSYNVSLCSCFGARTLHNIYNLGLCIRVHVYKSNRKAMNRNWSNQKANPALKTKAGNK